MIIQNARELPKFVCDSCKANRCYNCIDIVRAVFSQIDLCKCSRETHAGRTS